MDKSSPRVEFNLTYALSGFDFWNGVNGEKQWHPEKILIQDLFQRVGKSRPIVGSVCDRNGCWGNFGFNPSDHGDYTKAGFGTPPSPSTEGRRAGLQDMHLGGGHHEMRRGVGVGNLSQAQFEVR